VLTKLDQGSPSRDDGARRSEARRDGVGSRFSAQAEQYEERAREYERRAAEGGRGAKGWLRGAEGWRRAARKLHAEAERRREQFAREEERREQKRARRERRRADRASRRHAHGHRSFPGPLAWVFSLAFMIAMLAVWMATQVVVPVLLRTLALFFATRGLRAAADAVLTAGTSALRGMQQSREWFFAGVGGHRAEPHVSNEGSSHPHETRVRVTGVTDGPRVRVDGPGQGAEEEDHEGAPSTGAGAARS
jgi:hypothetical protein